MKRNAPDAGGKNGIGHSKAQKCPEVQETVAAHLGATPPHISTALYTTNSSSGSKRCIQSGIR